MEVFISWSKPESRAAAECFRNWLPRVIQECRSPYMSTETTKGDAWFESITGALDTAKVGIVFITRENQNETWLNFESGALVTKLGQRLCPVLVGLPRTDYTGPLKNLQLTEYEDQSDMLRLLKTINNECEIPLDHNDLEDALTLRWPHLQTAHQQAIEALPAQVAGATRGAEDKINEILELVREMQSQRTNRDGKVSLRKTIPMSARELEDNRLLSKRISELGGEHAFYEDKYLGKIVEIEKAGDLMILGILDEDGTVTQHSANGLRFDTIPF